MYLLDKGVSFSHHNLLFWIYRVEKDGLFPLERLAAEVLAKFPDSSK
jgi:hypothetical protein